MDLKITKYQFMLEKKINDQINNWRETQQIITNQQLYQFLHTIIGTAGTISMHEIAKVTSGLINKLSKEEQKNWKTEDVLHYLEPLVVLLKDKKQDLVLDVPPLQTPLTETEDKPLVLMIDEDIPYLIQIKDILEGSGYSVLVSPAIDKSMAIFYDVHPDCVVLGCSLGDTEGASFLKHVRDTLAHQLIPVVVLSERNEKAKRMRAFKLGADDFMEKSIESDELLVRLQRQLTRRTFLKELLLKDELTKVYNRKFLTDVYGRMLTEHERNKETFSLAILDLDHFKRINDTYGHSAGDYVLTEFSSFIRSFLRKQDVIIRYGGEEFIILMPYTKVSGALLTINRLLDQLKKHVFSFDKHSFSITFSAGVYDIESPLTLSEAVSTADNALYAAKEKGRNRVESAQVHAERKRKLKVAVIDDSEIIRSMLESFFKEIDVEKYEIEVQTYQDGFLFFNDDWHKTKDEYLIILDGVLPKMDGVEILQKLRQYPNTSQYTILMLTARKAEQDIVRALNMGADDYLTKPFSIRELEARTKVLIQRVK
ncbi:diguanylate cyclase [Fictibacillus sp. NPDC058756]|uniref:GGDEF domain-containing response regulator n=1 Tax=Fictibacillus sp. NPDC058756 TaxID=3346625 RepID=UPI0036B42EE0